jgi:uncharacterized protein (TIGR02246 family)
VAFSVLSELKFAKQFESRMSERVENGPVIYAATESYSQESITALQTLYQTTLQAWCRGDGTAYGLAFAEDAEYIAFTGEITRGRRAIASAHQELFDKWLKGSCLVGTIESIRFLTPDAVVIVALGGTTFDGKNVLRRPSIQTYTAVHQGGSWLFTNFQNSRVADGNVLQMMVLGIRTGLLRM